MSDHEAPMEASLDISTARMYFTSLPELLQGKNRALQVTRYTKPVLAVLPWELFVKLTGRTEIENLNAFERELRERITKEKSEEATS